MSFLNFFCLSHCTSPSQSQHSFLVTVKLFYCSNIVSFFASLPGVVYQSVLCLHLSVQKLMTTPESSSVIERNTRRQARSATWKEERRLRLTSSNFGVAAARQQWTLKGLQNMTSSKDISHVAPIKYVNDFNTSQDFFNIIKL